VNSVQVAPWEQQFASMTAEWEVALGAAPDAREAIVEQWSARLRSMSEEMNALRSAGHWLGGPRALLEALGRQHSEVDLTAALAWLLEPEGHHRLGDLLLHGLVHRLRLQVLALHPVRIVREETCNETRADLLVRLPGATILIEAKVWADEQPDQCTRLASDWADESPTLVYLTRDGKRPLTAGHGEKEWRTLCWADVALLIQQAISLLPPLREPALGVLDFLTTLIDFHGGTA
jgi:hypothetical protein